MRDLDDIYRFVIADRPSAAVRLRNAIIKGIEGLTRFPGSGRPGRVPNTRELVVPGTPFIVPYKVERDRLLILRIFHGAQSWPVE